VPQPLTSYDPTFLESGKGLSFASIGSGGGKAHKTFRGRHAHFGGLAMEVIAKWAVVENTLLLTASAFVGGPEHAVYQGLSALRARTSKLEVFRTIAEILVHADHRDLVGRMLRFYRSCEKRRNILAHHSWGFLHQKYDVALLIDYRDWHGRSREEFLPKVMVWTINDFEKLAMDIVDLQKCIDLLGSVSDAFASKNTMRTKELFVSSIEERLKSRGF
jgi:hypothetical protein